MDRSNAITLISSVYTKDDYGIDREQLVERCVYCNVQSVTQTEFFQAGRNGLNPEYRFTMFVGDYKGEQIVRFNGKTYSVYRTYLTRNDMIELYVERKGGTNGKAEKDQPN